MTTRVATHHAGADVTVPRFRTDIQGLRAVAALLVLSWHAAFGWLPAGYVGVDAFFVISGFLITGLLIEEQPTPVSR